MNNTLHLSRIRGIMLRLSFLGIILSFAFCSNQLDALKIKNDLNDRIKILSVSEGLAKSYLFHFIGTPISIASGKAITIKNKVQSPYASYGGSGSNDAAFENLIIYVEYKDKKYRFETGSLLKNVTNDLIKDELEIIFKKPTKGKIVDYYFNSKGKSNELNARFDPGVKFRRVLPEQG